MNNKIVREINFKEGDIITYPAKNEKKIFMDDNVYVNKVKPLIVFSSSDSDRINSFVSNIKIAEISGFELKLNELRMPVLETIEDEVMGIVEKTTGEYILLADQACMYLMKEDGKLYLSDEGIIFYVESNRIAITLDGFLWEEYQFDELSPDGIEVHIDEDEICLISNGITYNLSFLFDFEDEHPITPIVV